jgi:hypothetical protein
VSTASLGERGRFLDQRQRIVMAALCKGDVDQPDHVRGNAGQQAEFPAQPNRLFQLLARRVQPTGGMLRNAQVPQRFGHCLLVADLCRQLQGPLKNGNRGVVVAPDDLVEAANPEQRLSLTAHVTERLIEVRGALEQLQLMRILGRLLRILGSLLKEPAVNDPAAGQGQIGLDRIQFQIGYRQRELCAIALALGHQPADMLGPHEDYSTIQVTSDISAAPLEIAAWMQGSINSAVPSLLGGIALCEVCRVSLMARNSDDGTVYYCANLACRGPQVNKLASIIDPPVSALIVARLHTIDPQEVAKAHGRDIKAELAALDVELENFRRRRAETQRQFEELADYPQLSVKVLAKSLASFDQKIEQINREQVRVRRYATMAGIEDIAQWWDEAPLLQRRAIVEEMMTITIPASSEIDAEPADVQSSFKNIRYEWR